ncbi:MAG: 4-alpha-glucanotransferase, partial [Anaeroplasmataceae bacterium]|nr:4-alpha-glucanotransferase [Anaeroplasmataceae bacterium]
YKPWFLWEESYQKYSIELEKEIVANPEYLFWQWTQYEFFKEWTALHAYANLNKVKIMGDMPLYVAYDSVEVWKNPELFLLKEDKKLKLVAGCPPDVFSEDGQLWGNPIYDWKYMRSTNYAWWNERIKRSFKLYDYLRIDHFRGFDRYYAIPAEDDTARNGSWLDGPKFELFENKTKMPIIAEDLGMIDEGVRELLRKTGYPGMKVLAFAFDGNPHNDYLPSNYEKNAVVYTGTHDNMPVCQQLMDLDSNALEILLKGLKQECQSLKVPFNARNFKAITNTIVELAFASNAKISIVPMQDLLAQDGASRMNFPSSVSNQNWSYRIRKQDLSKALAKRILSYNQKYHR